MPDFTKEQLELILDQTGGDWAWWRSYHSQKQLDKEPEYQKLKQLRDRTKELLGESIQDD
jgi:hypothetical protein